MDVASRPLETLAAILLPPLPFRKLVNLAMRSLRACGSEFSFARCLKRFYSRSYSLCTFFPFRTATSPPRYRPYPAARVTAASATTMIHVGVDVDAQY